MKTKIIIASIWGAAMTLSSAASAQDKVTVNGNIDLANNYVWRGMDQNSGFSVQLTLGLSYKGLSLSAWGSQSLTNNAERATFRNWTLIYLTPLVDYQPH